MSWRAGILVLLVLVVGFIAFSRLTDEPSKGSGAALANVAVPDLSVVATEGEVLFNTSCASCHGVNAAGLDGSAPPLVHIIYEPNHHADGSFLLAVRNGVRAHHWKFGNMPPVEGVSDADLTKIVIYVRELQRANRID